MIWTGATNKSEPADLYTRARVAIQRNELENARLLLSAIIRADPVHAHAHAMLGALLLDRGEDERAIEMLTRAAQLDPGNARTRALASVALERTGELARAMKEAQAAAALDPTRPEVQRQLGHLYGRAGERDRSIDAWKKLVELTGGKEREALRALGIALSNDHRHEEAIAVLERAVTLEPRDASAHADLGMARLAAHRLADAEISFQQASNLNAACGQAHLGLGLTHARKKDWSRAIGEFRAAVRLVPSCTIAHFNLGLALEASGELEEARGVLLRASALAPDDIEIAASIDRVLGTKNGEEEKTDPNNSITGDLKPFPLTDLLEFLRMQAKSGTLTVTARSGTGIVRLRDGRLLSASSPSSKPLREQALATSEVRFEQIIDALSEILSWTEGTFSFQKQDDRSEQPEQTFDLQLTVLELFRRSDERIVPGNKR